MLFDPNFISDEFAQTLMSIWTIIGVSQKVMLSCEIEDVLPQVGVDMVDFIDSGFFNFQKLSDRDFKAELTLISNNHTLDDSTEDFENEDWTKPESTDELFQMLRSRIDRYRANVTLFLVDQTFAENKFFHGVLRMTCPANAQHEFLLAYDFSGSAWQFLFPQSVSVCLKYIITHLCSFRFLL